MVFNLSGYQSVNLLKSAEPYADIYLPDFKYADRELAGKLSRCRNYPDVALAALSEMLAQKGFLDTFVTGRRFGERKAFWSATSSFPGTWRTPWMR